jgi:hypothetical protein
MLERLGSTCIGLQTAQGAEPVEVTSSTGGPGTVCPGRLSQVDRSAGHPARIRSRLSTPDRAALVEPGRAAARPLWWWACRWPRY